MMTEWEREDFQQRAGQTAAAALARGEDLRAALAPLFHEVRRAHPDEEGRLFDLWDRLTSRRVM